MKHKEQYKKVKIKEFSYLELEKENYLIPIVKITEDKIEWQDEKSEIYLWALFGKTDLDEKFVCLQVGASIDGRHEIKGDIAKMNDLVCDVLSSGRSIDTQFYTDVYFVEDNKGIDKSTYQYRKIKENYKTLIFYKIDINKYLQVKDSEITNPHVRKIFNLSKAYYAETKFAFDTQAMYWNAYRSGVGMETLKQLIQLIPEP